MADGNKDEQGATLASYGLRALVAGALGALAGISLDLGSSLSGPLSGAVVGAAVGFGLASIAILYATASTVRGLDDRIDELETRDALTGLPNGRALRSWLDGYLPHANQVQSHTALLVIHADGIDA